MPSIDDVLAHADGTQFAIALSELVFSRCDRDGFTALTAPEQVAFCVDALEREVNNGGFEQFFTNSSGDTAAETVAALDAISAPAAAELVRRALALFPGSAAPADRDARCAIVDAASDDVRAAWRALDAVFCAYPDDLTTLMRRYVETHRAAFRSWP